MPNYLGSRRILQKGGGYPSKTFIPGVAQSFSVTLAPDTFGSDQFSFAAFAGNYAQVFSIDFNAGNVISASDYFQFETYTGSVNSYSVWYSVDGVGSSPGVGGTDIQVTIASSDDASTVASNTYSAVTGASPACSLSLGSTSITFTNTSVGAVNNAPHLVNSEIGSLNNIQSGSGPYTTVGGFTWWGGPTTSYYFWTNQDSLGSDPGPPSGEVVGIQVPITSGMSAVDFATQVAVYLQGAGIPYSQVNESLALTATDTGPITDGNVFGPGVYITKTGSTNGTNPTTYPAGTYFEFFDTAGTSFAPWLQKDGAGSAPGVATHEEAAAYSSVGATPSDVAAVVNSTLLDLAASFGNTFTSSVSGPAFTVRLSSIGTATSPNFPDSATFQNTALIPGSTVINLATESFTIPNHGFPTGLAVRLSCSGTLPSPLALNTTYYIIRVSANVLRFASSKANALAGTPINITTLGNGAAITIRQYP